VREQTQAREDGRPAPALGADVEHLDGERVARLGPGDGDRARERVDAIPVERLDHARVGVGADLVVADVARVDHDGVAGGDLQRRLLARVPREVQAVGWGVVRAGHWCTLRAYG